MVVKTQNNFKNHLLITLNCKTTKMFEVFSYLSNMYNFLI